MIFTPRSSDTNHTCTKINFRGFEISIAMDDRCLGGDRPLTRSSLAVHKGRYWGQDIGVSHHL